jgi:uncharacterized protein (TIGR02145 family)
MARSIKVLGVLIVVLLCYSCKKDDDKVIKDNDGNIYTAVTIGSQVWMLENLKTTHYNDGTSIPLVTDSLVWLNLSAPGYCWYNNDQVVYGSAYGALYNWHAVNTGKLCPKGWHVPTDEEWSILTDYAGSESVAGDKLKEAGPAHWGTINEDATNETGFTALPAGSRNGFQFYAAGDYASWWSATTTDNITAWCRVLYLGLSQAYREYNLKVFGHSVRCLKDN